MDKDFIGRSPDVHKFIGEEMGNLCREGRTNSKVRTSVQGMEDSGLRDVEAFDE